MAGPVARHSGRGGRADTKSRGVAPMFLGTHNPRLDEKNRVILPAKFREGLAEGIVITKGQERCLYVFPQTEFTRIAEALQQAPMSSKTARAYSRVFFASAHDETPDKQGRITIPARLREYAGLDRDLAVIGASNRVEIWNTTTWDDYLEASEEAFADIEEGDLPEGL